MIMDLTCPRKKQHGIVLVVVLWIVTLLSVMAASFVYSMRTETQLVSAQVDRAKARALAEAGIAYATKHILSPTALQKWPLEGTAREWHFGSGRVNIAIVGANGKVDINRSDRGLLRRLLASAGVEDEALDPLLDAIEDWRDSDDARGANGAEEQDYQAAGRDYGPKNAPFERIEELQQVLGMTQEIYHIIADELTVFSRQEGVNPAMASATLLRALPEIDTESVDEYLEARSESVIQGLPIPEAPFSNPHLSEGRTLAYHIRAKAVLDSGSTASIEAVITPGLKYDLPYRQLAWREGRSR